MDVEEDSVAEHMLKEGGVMMHLKMSLGSYLRIVVQLELKMIYSSNG